MMKSVIPILVQGTILALAPHNTNGEILLGKVSVSVVSNQTLQRVDEYNYTRPVLRDISPQALPSGQTENDLINQQLVMQMDVCFPKHYCPIVSTKEEQFKSTFNSHVCRQYCANPQYKSEVEVIDICDLSTYSNYGCVNFGLTTHASSISEAENIKMELGENMITSKPAWKELLNELAPYFDPDVTTPEIVGYHIGQDTGEVWHPAWDSGTELCSKDSNVPFYMKLDPDEYLAPTMTDCCRKHYWWNVRGCAEPQNRPCPEGWVQTAEQTAREGIMSGKYYGSVSQFQLIVSVMWFKSMPIFTNIANKLCYAIPSVSQHLLFGMVRQDYIFGVSSCLVCMKSH